MAETKFSFIRYRVLDRCLRNPVGHYQIKDLLYECKKELQIDNLSRRTIYYDLEFMASSDGWDAPIKSFPNGNKRYYRYTDPDFSIMKMPISEVKLKQIQSAVDILKQVVGLPQFDSLRDNLDNIDMITHDNSAQPCLSFDHNSRLNLVGKSFLSDLFNAIQYKKAVAITYKPYGEDTIKCIFHPQFLKQYNNRWYIFGVEDNHLDEIWNLAIDRIQLIQPTETLYIKKHINWEFYFEDIIGVTNYINEPVEDIHFLVHGIAGHYIKTKPLHESQHANWINENTLDVKLQVKINHELSNTLMSYADSITILAPQRLIDEHKERLRKALQQYGKDGSRFSDDYK